MSGLALNSITKQFGPFTASTMSSFPCRTAPSSACSPLGLRQDHAASDDRRLDSPTEGAIVLDGKDITQVPTHKRDLGMVFQSLALFRI